MRKWLLKLIAGDSIVLINADITSPEFLIKKPSGVGFISINSWLNYSRLERAGMLMKRYDRVTGEPY